MVSSLCGPWTLGTTVAMRAAPDPRLRGRSEAALTGKVGAASARGRRSASCPALPGGGESHATRPHRSGCSKLITPRRHSDRTGMPHVPRWSDRHTSRPSARRRPFTTTAARSSPTSHFSDSELVNTCREAIESRVTFTVVSGHSEGAAAGSMRPSPATDTEPRDVDAAKEVSSHAGALPVFHTRSCRPGTCRRTDAGALLPFDHRNRCLRGRLRTPGRRLVPAVTSTCPPVRV